jgi:predicted hydrolase (HD superfamily)
MTTGRGSCLAASVGRDARAHDGAVAAPRTTDLAVRAAAPGTVGDVRDSDDAARLAEKMLAAELPRRWLHVRSVARRARWTAKQLSLSEDLVAAAWLHDIGYAQELVETGFHPLDGARYLRRIGIDAQVVSLVAYHSCAEIETEVRGLDE